MEFARRVKFLLSGDDNPVRNRQLDVRGRNETVKTVQMVKGRGGREVPFCFLHTYS